MKKTLWVMSSAFVLAACMESNGPVQTVEWWKEHATERAEMLAKCRNNPGELAATPNCVNSRKAQSQVAFSAKGYGGTPEPLTFEKKKKE